MLRCWAWSVLPPYKRCPCLHNRLSLLCLATPRGVGFVISEPIGYVIGAPSMSP